MADNVFVEISKFAIFFFTVIFRPVSFPHTYFHEASAQMKKNGCKLVENGSDKKCINVAGKC